MHGTCREGGKPAVTTPDPRLSNPKLWQVTCECHGARHTEDWSQLFRR